MEIKIIDKKFFKDDFAKQNCAAAQRTRMVLCFYAGNASYLSMVHEVEKTSHVVFVHIAQDDYGMLAGVALQGKHNFVETRQFWGGGGGGAGGSISFKKHVTVHWDFKIV